MRLVLALALLAACSQAAAAVVGVRQGSPSMLRSSRVLRRAPCPLASVKDIGSEKEFKEALKSAGDALVIIDYSTSWCGPCKVIAPKFEEFSQQYSSASFYQVIGDSSSDANKLMSKQGIRAVPTFQLWKNNKKVCEISGAKAAALEEAIQANV